MTKPWEGIEYWEDPEAFEERNRQLVAEKEAGMKNRELANKYNISETRVQAIIKQTKDRRKFLKEVEDEINRRLDQ